MPFRIYNSEQPIRRYTTQEDVEESSQKLGAIICSTRHFEVKSE
jgi:hypothetical protein